MPFKSEKQRKWMWANEPEMAEKWEKEEDEKNEGNIVRISKRQLRRIIKEEKQKLQEQLGPKEIEYQGEEWHEAWDALNEGLVNLVAGAINAGLLEDDLNAAWGETKIYVRDMLDSEGGY